MTTILLYKRIYTLEQKEKEERLKRRQALMEQLQQTIRDTTFSFVLKHINNRYGYYYVYECVCNKKTDKRRLERLVEKLVLLVRHNVPEEKTGGWDLSRKVFTSETLKFYKVKMDKLNSKGLFTYFFNATKLTLKQLERFVACKKCSLHFTKGLPLYRIKIKCYCH